MNMRSPMSKVRGLGSAKEGSKHWWAQRITAALMVPLGLWFVYAVSLIVTGGHADVVEWLSHPVQSVLLLTLLLVMCYHAALGLQVVLEDYVSDHGLQLVLILLSKAVFFFAAIAAVLSVIKIHLMGA